MQLHVAQRKPLKSRLVIAEEETEDGEEGEEEESIREFSEATKPLMAEDKAIGRIGEDTPKYLKNLGSASAFYDPKTRSMREDAENEVELKANLAEINEIFMDLQQIVQVWMHCYY